MELYTLDVGQGAFAVLVGDKEAIIIDTHIPSKYATKKEEAVFIKAVLPKILNGKKLKGIIQTGFDSDHFNLIGLKMIMNKYKPKWIIYPSYYKDSQNADECFKFIDEYDNKNKSFSKVPIGLTDIPKRWNFELSNEWSFEFFSPYRYDNEHSNNKSIVCKIHPKARTTRKFSILITGDTESRRWNKIVRYFGDAIDADVLMAPHHGSKNGITQEAYDLIDPYHVLISAGTTNRYRHPHKDAINIFKSNGALVCGTHKGGSLVTYRYRGQYYTDVYTDFDNL